MTNNTEDDAILTNASGRTWLPDICHWTISDYIIIKPSQLQFTYFSLKMCKLKLYSALCALSRKLSSKHCDFHFAQIFIVSPKKDKYVCTKIETHI